MGATVAVAAIVAGWVLAQRPQFLPGLTIEQAAAGRSALIAIVVGVALGAVVLVPSLALLYGLFLRGRFDPHAVEAEVTTAAPRKAATPSPQLGLLALALLGTGGTLTFFFEASWAHIVGVTALLGFVGLGFVALAELVAGAER